MALLSDNFNPTINPSPVIDELGNTVNRVRTDYRHLVCAGVTRMGQSWAMTFASNPTYYRVLFCARCLEAYPVSGFVWADDGTEVGT